MMKLLLLAAGFGLAVSSAQACESKNHNHNAKATVDQTTVASVAVPQSEPVIVQEQANGAKADESAK